MVFDRNEVAAILKRHVVQTLGVPETQVKDVEFLDSEGVNSDLENASVEVSTIGGVIPGLGPYRSQGK